MTCQHVNVLPDVFDMAPGVYCIDCDTILEWCWGDVHVSERLWNRACKAQPEDFEPREQDRESHCAVCGSEMVSGESGVV